jgi:hypothetical protein
MKRNTSKSTEKRSHSQKPAESPEKKKKNASFTQGDLISEDIDDILFDINLKRARSAYNIYVSEMMAKDKVSSIVEASRIYPKKWQKLPTSEKKKYEEMFEKEKERHAQHLELVKRHLLQKPLKQGATAYRIYLEEQVRKAIDNNQDPDEAKKDASATWKNMSADEKREYNDKKKDHDEFYENLKKSTGYVNAYSLFLKDQMAKAKEKGESMTFKIVAEMWKKQKQSVKDKYSQYAEEFNGDRAKQRDIYEITFGLKPRRPLGAYKFFLMEAAKEGKLGKNPIKEGPKAWKKLSEEEKEKYQRIAQKEKLIYLVKKREYESQIKKSSSTRPQSAFNLYVADLKDKVDSKDIGPGGFFDYCYKKWNKMEESAKRKYFQRAEEQKEVSEKAKEEFMARVYNIPKRPANTYNIYIQHSLPDLQKSHPKKEVTELFKILGDQWHTLSDKQKEKFGKLYEKNLDVYKSQYQQWEENGYYTPNGEGKKKNPRSSSRKESETKSTKRKKSVKE